MGNSLFVATMIIGNLLGALIGFFYYFNVIGLIPYSPILWVLIPDCPMAVLLLLGVYIQRDGQYFLNYNFFVFIQGIRAAIITFLIILNFGSLDVEIVFLGHFLLLVQAIAILPLLTEMKFNKGTLSVIGITLFNDIFDFFGFLGFFKPTLAQLPNIQPMLPWLVIVIFGLDIVLILIGLGFAWFMNEEHL
ncbi:MAG: DUF1405 domain-containing protein [Candidatus Hodarchaeales archaeon]